MRTGTKIILGAAVLALVLIAGKFFLSEVSFSPANPSWDGASCMMTADTRPLYGFDGLPPGDSGSTLLIVGPTVNYTSADASRVERIPPAGRPRGRPGRLRDGERPAARHQRADHHPAHGALPGPRLLQEALLSRRPRREEQQPDRERERAGLQPPGAAGRSPATRRCWRRPRSWAGSTSTARAASTGNEKFGSYPLIARAAYGAGELFVAGDADLAINAMQDQGDDGVLMGNVRRSGMLYLDVGHGQQVPPLAWLYYTIKYNIVAQIVFALLIFIVGYAYVARGRLFRRREAEEEPRADPRGALIASMKARLPLSDREIEEIKKKL